MIKLLRLAADMANSFFPILIEGESGTGKELIARYIHKCSQRNDKPFIVINCVLFTAELFESELFGHTKGSFSGAVRDRKGRIEAADGGTLFFDDITEFSLVMQKKLIRFFQSHEFERLGENQTRKINVRIIASTSSILKEAIKNRAFDENLFYILKTVWLKTIPLQERPEDIIPLTEHFIKEITKENTTKFSQQALKAIRAYSWKGNALELKNVIEYALSMAKRNIIKLYHLSEEVQFSVNSPVFSTLEEIKKIHIQRVLSFAKDYEEASSILGIDSATLLRKRKKYNLQR